MSSSENDTPNASQDHEQRLVKPVDAGNQTKSFFSRFKSSKPAADKPPPPPRVKFYQLFRYTTLQERFYILISVISACIHGALLPLFSVIFGQLINEFASETVDGRDDSLILDSVGDQAKWFLVLAAVAFVTSAIQVRFQLVVAQRVCARLRQMFFESVMSQDFTWYDGHDGGALTAHVANDVNVIQAGIGDKVTTATQFIATFFVGIVIAFVYGPLLTLVVLSVAPLLMIGGAVFAKMAEANTGDGLGAYASAGAVATEVIGLIRVVSAYNGQKSETDRYSAQLDRAYTANIKKSVSGGLGLGITMFIIFCSYSISFTFGAQQVRNGKLDVGDILTSFFAVIIACVSIGQAAPSFSSFAQAQGAAVAIYDIIERKSEINPLDEEEGDTIPNFKGHVLFNNVDFSYKSAPDTTIETENEPRSLVLSNFSVEAPPGTSHALVGPSGCGKSTTARLIERFYDVNNGSVLLDGIDVRTLNVRWLRSQMGYVGQMPTLFMLSIRENIALGAAMEVTVDEKTGEKVLRRQHVTEDEIIEAAKMANAHDFIMRLPEQYDTMLGERGALLSGGQKQRVCIARALIRNPKILILDESTAALDAQSERIVQQALEKAAAGRTTITIAHRLSTVRNADVISVIDQGSVVEAGKHAELMKVENGAYRKLVEHQNIEAQKNENMLQKKEGDGGESAKAQVLNTSVTKTRTSGPIAPGDDEETKEEEPDVDPGVLKRAFLLNAKEWLYILLGTIGGALAGAAFPLSAILFSEAIDTIAVAENNTASNVRRYALLYLGIGGIAFLGNVMQLTFLGVSGERLTRKLRLGCFKAILRQEMGFFDEKRNALGALTTRLAMDASLVQGVTGNTLGGFAFVAGTILTGFLVSYLACWRVALVVTAMFPLMAIAGALQVKMMTGFDSDSDKKYMTAGAVASEAVDNFETITASGVQDVFINRYNTELDIPVVNGRRTALIAGFAFGMAEAMSFALWAVSFWVGSIFVENGSCQFPDLMKAITGLLFGGMMLGQVSTYLPDVTKSKIAATKVFRLLDRVSKIDPTNEGGSKDPIGGEVKLDKVTFEYPTRSDVPVLRGLSVEVGKGKTLALVGSSGCGKSTVVALLERFYDPRTGELRFDGTAMKDYNLGWVRKNMGLVSQEPDLFNRSIRDNIAYGLGHEDGTVVTDEMIEAAAKAANVHSFVSEMTEGYDTVVGQRGSRLSGGQRQRVAIARAIVSGPKFLLLDEATSALDAVSERVVQEALDRAGAGRTTVAIAHRLSTVKDADAIAVVARGKIVEIGTHDQLLRIQDGEYANLVKNQLSGNAESSSQS